jgi:integrase/recombinase XerD
MQTESTGGDIYGLPGKLKRKLAWIRKAEEVSPHNRSKILGFERHCRASGIGVARTLRYLQDLPRFAEMLGKDAEKATRADVERVLRAIEDSDYSPRTKLDFKASVKRFYKWLNGGEEYPDCVRWIKTGAKLNNEKIPDALLTEEDVKKVIGVCRNSRDRALLSTLWESGCRVSELLTLHIGHVAIEETITRITVHGKTGMRRVPLLDSTPYLVEWLDDHPLKEEPNAPLWVGIGNPGRGRRLQYGAFRKMLRETARRAGIKKDVNPHNFRHSRATFLAKHLTEAQMNQYFGWVRGSDMPATYVHLSGRDIDESILKMRGLLKPKEEAVESSLAPIPCPRCKLMNKATGKFCARCGAVLDIGTAVGMQEKVKELDEKFSRLLSDRSVQEFLVKKLGELGIT